MARYKVVGNHTMFDRYRPGETFEAVMGKDQETYYITAGHLKRLPDREPAKTDKGDERGGKR